MMNRFVLALMLFPFFGFSQPKEVLNDLISNQTLQNSEKRINVGNFVYLIDTLDLPILDDFSGNHFKNYDAQVGDSNVSDTLFFNLYDATNTTPEPDSVQFSIDTTFTYVYDTLSTIDSIVEVKIAFPSQMVVDHDLSQYPVTNTLIEVWPGYNVFDSSNMVAMDVIDTLYLSPADLIQDSIRYYFVAIVGADTNDIWEDNYACLNSRYPINPPTVGVATFDGLNENGYPYDFNQGATPHGVADYLTSKPISMAQYSTDSVYISFHYQSTGLGNEPEADDSLVLEFWVPSQSIWENVWGVPGEVADTFKYVAVKVDSSKYFADGFKFRFKNYASLSGNLDHWNLDYVYLNKSRAYDDSIRPDLAFVYESFGLLQDYTSMPWKHYKWDPLGFTADTSFALVYNNNLSAEDLFSGDLDIKFNGTVVRTIPLVTLFPNVADTSQAEIFYTEPLIEFDTTLDDTCALFTLCHSIQTDDQIEYRSNDTIRYEQHFSNYYAYDDGTAEAAYGPYGGGASLAYQFEVLQEDSIRSVMMHFSPSVEDVSQNLFRLTIWDDAGGQPGNILYQTPALLSENPIYTNEKNGFYEYFMDQDERIAVSGTYYVGWVQSDPESLNIGFDRNVNKSDRIFYNASGFWTNTSFEGALLMRPVFVSDKDAWLGIEAELTQFEFTLYPNPSNSYLNYSINTFGDYSFEIMDLNGRIIKEGPADGSQVSVVDFANGMYIFRMTDVNSGWTVTEKFLKN